MPPAFNLSQDQILTGDATDNIQGIKGLGPKTAEKILKDVAYEYMLDKVIDTYRLKCGSTWEHELCKSANLIYIRMTSDDLRPFTFEELKEKLAWRDDGNKENINTLDVSGETISEPG